MYRQIKTTQRSIFIIMFLVPNPTAWPALPEREGGRERESKEKSIVQLKQPQLCIFWAGGETDGEDLCERGSLTPVATVPAGAKGRRFCKMNKLLYYLADTSFLTTQVVPTTQKPITGCLKQNRGLSVYPAFTPPDLSTGKQQDTLASKKCEQLPPAEGKASQPFVLLSLPSLMLCHSQ